MRLFNTLSGELEAIQPRADKKPLGFYCCGPTVYAAGHVGNFRTFVLQDVLRRTLELSGIPVHHVRNLTDIDDKTIAAARREGVSLKELTDKWTQQFHEDCDALHLLRPHAEPRATEKIPEQIAMIETLVRKGHAYECAGSIYFKIASCEHYGQLSGQVPKTPKDSSMRSGGEADAAGDSGAIGDAEASDAGATGDAMDVASDSGATSCCGTGSAGHRSEASVAAAMRAVGGAEGGDDLDAMDAAGERNAAEATAGTADADAMAADAAGDLAAAGLGDASGATIRRNDADEYQKDAAADFVLWKAATAADGENVFESPWGKGRPGWHIECSAMAKAELGDTIDLHSGGVDLKFPHHENEIAQSQCAHGVAFCKHWFHINHLKIEGQKMSKSLNNCWTLADLKKMDFRPAVVRLALLKAHYRKPLNLTLQSLRDAAGELLRLRGGLSVLEGRLYNMKHVFSDLSFDPSTDPLPADCGLLEDLNVPKALGYLYKKFAELELLGACVVDGHNTSVDSQGLQKNRDYFRGVEGCRKVVEVLLGEKRKPLKDIPEEGDGSLVSDEEFMRELRALYVLSAPEAVRALARERSITRAEGNYAEADALRKEIESHGWLVRDVRIPKGNQELKADATNPDADTSAEDFVLHPLIK